eukprot:297852-Amphidinium_carterae.1
MPPNSQHSHRVAREYLLHFTLWLQLANPGFEGDKRALAKLAEFGFRHGCIARFGIPLGQLAMRLSSMSSDMLVQQWAVVDQKLPPSGPLTVVHEKRKK